MPRTPLQFWVGACCALMSWSVHAWTGHAWGTWLALQSLPDVRTEAPVRAESLEKLLIEQGPALEAVLQHEEQWARAHVRNYPARPEVLAYRFEPGLDAAELRRRFLMALRVHSQTPLPLYLQVMPTPQAQAANQGRATLTWSDVTLYKDNAPPLLARKFVSVREGEPVAVLDVLATASDEPDFGLDSGLWSDSGTEHGRVYGFGPQPLANMHLPRGEQAPFHVGFFHESPAVYATLAGLRRTYPEYRMHLWQSLARHALVNGHPYWGWRFAGWAMHYAQELTEPYHAQLLPGVGVSQLLWQNMRDLAGAPQAQAQAFQLVANHRFLFELYYQQSLLVPLQKGEFDHPNLQPFARVQQDAGRMALPENGLREQVAREAHDRAEALDQSVCAVFPPRWANEAQQDLSTELVPFDLYQRLQTQRPAALDGLDAMAREISQHFGNVTRAIWRRLQ